MIYRRRIDPDGSDSLAKLARWVRPGATVLELGAAAGYFTGHLRSLGCTVDVIEIDAAAANEAGAYARRTIVADLDGDAWVAALGDARYDAIVCADVLEHLRNGAALLRRLRPFVADGGHLLLSVPNVAHSAIIARLVDERFEYGGEGLLDPTHVRLYTWRSLAAVLREAGWRAEAWDATTLDAYATEFRVREDALAPALRSLLDTRPHAHVYQWLVRAVPGAGDGAVPGATPATATVPVRLLHATSDDGLTLERALPGALPTGGAPTTFTWSLPPGTRAVRLLLADRVGILDVPAFALQAGAAGVWSADDGRLAEGRGTLRVAADRFALIAPDAWIAPDLAGDEVARADRVVATLAWQGGVAQTDADAVFEALAVALVAERDAAERTRHELATLVQELESRSAAERREYQRARSLIEEARRAVDEVHATLAQRDRAFADLEQAVAAYRTENERLERAVAAQERIIGYRQSLRWWLKLPFVRARLAWNRARGR